VATADTEERSLRSAHHGLKLAAKHTIRTADDLLRHFFPALPLFDSGTNANVGASGELQLGHEAVRTLFWTLKKLPYGNYPTKDMARSFEVNSPIVTIGGESES